MRIGITGAKGFIGSHLKTKLANPIVFNKDLTDLPEVRNLIRNCDRIYHLAGKNREEPGNIAKNNIISTSNIVLATILEDTYPEIIFASSKQVEWNPNSEYGFTKSIEEEIIKKTNNWCIYRIPNVYGPGCRPFYNSVVATFCHQIAKGETVEIHDPDAKREFIYIDELIQGLLRPEFNKYINLKGEELTIGEIYDYLTTKLGQHEKLAKCLRYYKKGE